MAEDCKPNSNKEYTDREYFTLWIKNLKELLDERWHTQEVNVALALKVIDDRLEGMNEWRQQSKDQTNTYATIEAVRLITDAIKATINNDKESFNKELNLVRIDTKVLDTKANINQANLATAIGLISLAVSIILHFI